MWPKKVWLQCIAVDVVDHLHTYLANKLDFNALMLQPLPRILQCDVHLPTDSFAIIEKEIFVFLPIFSLVLSLLSRLSVIEDHVDFCTLSKTEETHCNPATLLTLILATTFFFSGKLHLETPDNDVLKVDKTTHGGACVLKCVLQFAVHTINLKISRF